MKRRFKNLKVESTNGCQFCLMGEEPLHRPYLGIYYSGGSYITSIEGGTLKRLAQAILRRLEAR